MEQILNDDVPGGVALGELIKDGTIETFQADVLEASVTTPIIVDFWATWCAPCIREMPGLDKLEAKLGGPDFAVVAVNEDRGGAKFAKPFLEKLNTPNLGLYFDDNMKLMRAFGVRGMPTSFLLDRAGNVVGKLEGIAEWDTPEVEALIQYYTNVR